MRIRQMFVGLLFTLIGIGLAQPEGLAVYPFASQDVRLGVAIAERIATVLSEALEAEAVYGPAVTPALVPPLVVEDGFLSPLAYLSGSFESTDLSDANGAALLRDTLGVGAALVGEVRFAEEGLELSLSLATPDGVRTYLLDAAEDEPGALAQEAVAVVAAALDVAVSPMSLTIDLSGPYGDYIDAVTLLGGGFIGEAEEALERALEAEENTGDKTWRAVLEDIRATEEGETGSDPALQAAVSLNLTPFDTESAERYFGRLADATALPAAPLWAAVLKLGGGDEAGAREAFERVDYPYGRAAAALYRAVHELEARAEVESLVEAEGRGTLLAASLAAQALGEVELEKRLLERLGEMAPGFAYSFERRSFIAFDEDDPLAAAQALAVATRLEPDNDLYWTNLGWAYYLLGLFGESEEASLTAVELAPNAVIALYNLGLVRATTGRLDEAMEAYDQALALDPEVDDEAVADLERALEERTADPALHFALATLLEAEGREERAEAQYERYLERGDASPRITEARARLDALRAPPPPINVSSTAALGLGRARFEAAPYHPGDRLYPSFELSTPGFELPDEVEVTLSLLEEGTPIEGVSASQPVRIPDEAVALQVENVGLELPRDLPPGAYTLQVRVDADEDREATLQLGLEVAGEPTLLRGLLGRDIAMRSLSGSPLYTEGLLGQGDEALLARLVAELRASADAADETLPEVETGRFEGLGGGALFSESSEADVRDFLTFLLAGGSQDASFVFADAYAQWALDGAPTEGGGQ